MKHKTIARGNNQPSNQNTEWTFPLRQLSGQWLSASRARRACPATHFFFDFTGGASAMAASAVSIRKENVSCKYRATVVSVWFE